MENDRIAAAYRIQTRRLVLRCWQPEDARLLKEAVDASLDHLRPWMPWADQEPTDLAFKAATLRRFRGQFDLDQDYVYGVFNPDESQVLGGSGLHTRLGEGAREIGYWIHAAHTRQGLATELSAALTRVAFEHLHVNRVEIHCDPINERSASVARKLGYIHEATLRARLPQRNGWRDVMIWSLFASDYPASPSAQAEIEAFDVLGNRLI